MIYRTNAISSVYKHAKQSYEVFIGTNVCNQKKKYKSTYENGEPQVQKSGYLREGTEMSSEGAT